MVKFTPAHPGATKDKEIPATYPLSNINTQDKTNEIN